MAGDVFQDTITDLRILSVVGPESWGEDGETIISELFGDATVDLPVNVNSVQLPNESDTIRDVPNNGLTMAQLPVGLEPMDFGFEMNGLHGSRLATLRGYVCEFEATFVSRAPDDIDEFGTQFVVRKQQMRGNLRDAEVSSASHDTPQTWTFMQRVGELRRWEVLSDNSIVFLRHINTDDWIDASGRNADIAQLHNRWEAEKKVRAAL